MINIPETLEAVISRTWRLPSGRRGERSSRPWWNCPFHPDGNPSLTLTPDGERWKCFGCSLSGDAVEFVRKLDPSLTFADALDALNARDAVSRRPRTVTRPVPARKREPERPEGWSDFALQVVEEAEAALWTPAGSKARQYLAVRGLREGTIRAARLGYWHADESRRAPFDDLPFYIPRGITIPWFGVEALEAVNIRRPVKGCLGSDVASHDAKKYHHLRGGRKTIFPGSAGIVPGRGLIVAEGEFDCLLLGQELGELAPVVTLGSAGDRPGPRVLSAMTMASPWYVTHHDDGAGQKAAEGWMARSGRCRRVVPPAGDWTDAFLDGYDLRQVWVEILAGRDPDRFDPSWYEPYTEGEVGPIPSPGGIDIPADHWRWRVANLPEAEWIAWRRRSTALQPPNPTAWDIETAEIDAYLELIQDQSA